MEIIRNMARRKLRSTLTISGIVIGIFALTTMGAMAEYFNALIDGGVVYFGSNIQVTADTGLGTSVLSLDTIKRVESVDGVAAAFGAVQVPAKPGQTITVSFGIPDYIAGTQPGENSYSKFKLSLKSGHELTSSSRGDVVLGSTFADEFKKKVGDVIDLPVRPADAKPDFVNHTFNVVGLYEKTRTAPDTGAFISLADAQTLFNESLPAAIRGNIDTSNLVQSITAYGKPGQDLDKLADKITAEVPGVKGIKPSTIVSSFKSGGAIFTAITTGAALLALVIGGLSVVNTMIMAVTERTREIGLKKAVGAHTGHVLREYLLEAVLIGFFGGVVGILLGAGLTSLLNAVAGSTNQLFLLTPNLIGLALGFAVALGALAGTIPAVRAARMDPVLALRSQ
jgi:putative ABC transport system permease protein